MLALLARVKNLLLSPASEWDVIDREAVEPRRLALRYVAPLALIPAAAIVIALSVLGVNANGASYRAPILGVALSALVFFTLTILGVFLFAGVVNWLAPRFGAERNYHQAFKLSAYSITAAMVAGLLAFAPPLQVLALLGASYSLYLLFVGAPKLMHAPARSAVNYSIATTLSAIAMALVVGLAAMMAAAPSGAVFPGLPRLGLLDQVRITPDAPAAQSLADPSSAGTLRPGGPVQPLSGGDLRGVAPQGLIGLNRVSVGFERRGSPGQSTVTLEAEYRNGPRRMTLQIVHSDQIAGAIGFGGPGTLEYDRETVDGFSRRRRAGDAIIVETWDSASETGSYGRLVQDRFYVRASGGGGLKLADLREAVETFGQETLAQFDAEG